MTGRQAIPLAELLELFQRQIVAGQMEQAVEQHRTMTGGQYKTIPVGPIRILGVMSQELGPKHVSSIGHAHGHTGMAGIGLLHSINRQGPYSINTKLVKVGISHC